MTLPKFGAAPAVWSVAMVFFQSVLCLGYLYAHALARLSSPVLSKAVHSLVLIIGLTSLPVAIPAGWDIVLPDKGEMVLLLALYAS